jgi:uncharacterized phage-associated protein
VLSAKDVAEYYISIANPERQDLLTNLKIQKLLYYGQGFALGRWRSILFPERIIAWQLGPVVLEVYEAYGKYGASPVPLSPYFDPNKYEPDTKVLLNKVFSSYGQYAASTLVDMTHGEPPWKKTKINHEISIKHMQDYFFKIAATLD